MSTLAEKCQVIDVQEEANSTEPTSEDIEGSLLDKENESSVPEYYVEVKIDSSKVASDCRICHLTLNAANPDHGVSIELGCSCKGDLATAHKQCAEAWFKIKGNKTCEICGSIAHNVAASVEGEAMNRWNEASNATATGAIATPASHTMERKDILLGHRFLNFLLACMVFAFVISWLFHFNVPS